MLDAFLSTKLGIRERKLIDSKVCVEESAKIIKKIDVVNDQQKEEYRLWYTTEKIKKNSDL